MTLDDFKKFRVKPPERCRYLGMWENADVCFVVFEFPNRAKLRVTYWKPALQLLVCVRDARGVYNCIGNNVKTLEAYQEMMANFDWRNYDAGKVKYVKYGNTQPDASTKEDEKELETIRLRLAGMGDKGKPADLPDFGSLE